MTVGEEKREAERVAALIKLVVRLGYQTGWHTRHGLVVFLNRHVWKAEVRSERVTQLTALFEVAPTEVSWARSTV